MSNKLDLPKTLQHPGSSRSDLDTVLSGGGVPVGTQTTEKQDMGTSGESGTAGILGKSSTKKQWAKLMTQQVAFRQLSDIITGK